MATAVQEFIGTVGVAGINAEVGESQRLFAQQCEMRSAEAVESGQCEPFTVANFNPFPLGLQGVLKQYKVPSAYDERLPSDVLRGEIEYEGKPRAWHALTIREPKKDGKMIGATAGKTPGEPTVQREPKLYLPKEIAFSFMEHFSPIFTARPGTVLPPAPKDARRVFGVLVFQGDVGWLQRVIEETDPARRVLLVPVCHIQTVGKSSIKSYRTVQFSLDAYLKQMFEGQKRYCDSAITRAQQKWNGTDDDRKNISDLDRTLYRFAIDLGWAKKPAPGEKTWLNEYLTLVGDDAKVDVRLRKCQACKTLEPEPDTPFCPKCNAPIDTFKTFMDGFPVPEAWLHTLRGDEREAVLAEIKIRKQGFGEESAAPVAAAPAKRGPYKRGGRVIDPTEEVPAAETLAMDGEE